MRHQLSTAKAEVYEPMIELLRTMLDASRTGKGTGDERKLRETLSKFTAWVSVYGSDEAVYAFHKFMQTTYHSPEDPGRILIYYYGRFLLAVRRDLGIPNTTVTIPQLLGLRITDAWDKMGDWGAKSEEEFLISEGWMPPWPKDFGKGLLGEGTGASPGRSRKG